MSRGDLGRAVFVGIGGTRGPLRSVRTYQPPRRTTQPVNEGIINSNSGADEEGRGCTLR